MNSMGVRAALSVLLLFIATVKADGGTTFWRTEFTMKCPQNGTWFKKQIDTNHASETYTLQYDHTTKGSYHCEYLNQDTSAKTKYYFYVKGNVCANCFELNAALFGVAIVANIVSTVVVMMIICSCTKKKSSAGPAHTPKAHARPGGRAPPVPSPDYDHLNPHTRSQDAYDFLNRTG
ncbi:T-cell surface glycoprotein CD3 epsilon chain-like [Cottoperca gobio]|uniref:T-cell surface glycoprotein CD3 epsilon chain-like n=1 Tax=Cottoperca gobio TaxID=56716 RepID=A0A6J2QWW5_COTGO|nr:T-cell surface glycoprotein CD3 epsilon chain [Cottoperca gobio]